LGRGGGGLRCAADDAEDGTGQDERETVHGTPIGILGIAGTEVKTRG
jgi:hypothetical protein